MDGVGDTALKTVMTTKATAVLKRTTGKDLLTIPSAKSVQWNKEYGIHFQKNRKKHLLGD